MPALHRHLGIPQQILLLCQLCLSVQDLQVEAGVAQADDDIALMHHRAFLYNLLHHDAAFLWRDLYYLDGQHLSVGPDIVLKLCLTYLADGQLVLAHSECRGVIAEQ